MGNERLTEWIDDGEEKHAVPRMDLRNNGHQKCCNKLAEHEDLEEQGLLLRLPCKVGDKAWYVHKDEIDEVEVDSFVFNINLFANVSFYISGERFGKTLTPYKTLFFTQTEAEEKLRELEEKRNEDFVRQM